MEVVWSDDEADEVAKLSERGGVHYKATNHKADVAARYSTQNPTQLSQGVSDLRMFSQPAQSGVRSIPTTVPTAVLWPPIVPKLTSRTNPHLPSTHHRKEYHRLYSALEHEIWSTPKESAPGAGANSHKSGRSHQKESERLPSHPQKSRQNKSNACELGTPDSAVQVPLQEPAPLAPNKPQPQVLGSWGVERETHRTRPEEIEECTFDASAECSQVQAPLRSVPKAPTQGARSQQEVERIASSILPIDDEDWTRPSTRSCKNAPLPKRQKTKPGAWKKAKKFSIIDHPIQKPSEFVGGSCLGSDKPKMLSLFPEWDDEPKFVPARSFQKDPFSKGSRAQERSPSPPRPAGGGGGCGDDIPEEERQQSPSSKHPSPPPTHALHLLPQDSSPIRQANLQSVRSTARLPGSSGLAAQLQKVLRSERGNSTPPQPTFGSQGVDGLVVEVTAQQPECHLLKVQCVRTDNQAAFMVVLPLKTARELNPGIDIGVRLRIQQPWYEVLIPNRGFSAIVCPRSIFT